MMKQETRGEEVQPFDLLDLFGYIQIFEDEFRIVP